MLHPAARHRAYRGDEAPVEEAMNAQPGKSPPRRRAATAGGITVKTRVRFGFTAAPGSTDDGRMRRLTQRLPPVYARRLFDAQAAGSPDARLQAVVAEGLQEVYFRDGGRRAPGLVVEFAGIDYIEVEY